MAIKKYPINEEYPQEDMNYTFGEEGSAPIEVGPTDDLPFRYTQQALNPRGEAVSGQAQRDPEARSAFTGLANDPAGLRGDILYQNQLPMRSATIASGDMGAYKDLKGYSDINDPNSLRGREAIAQLGGFEGKTQTTNVFDMPAIGRGLGLKDEAVSQLMNMQHNQTYMRQESHENERGRVSKQDVGVAQSEKPTEGDYRTISNVSSDTSALKGKGLFHHSDRGDTEAFFRGLMRLSDQGENGGHQKNLDLDLSRPEHMAYVVNLGRNNDYAQGYTGDLYKEQREYDRGIDRAGDSNKRQALFSSIVKGIVIGGMAAMTGGAAGAVVGGMMGTGVGAGIGTGVAAGGVGGATYSGLSGAMSEEGFSWRDTAKGGAYGAIGGGVIGGIGAYANQPGTISLAQAGSSGGSSVGSGIAGKAGSPVMDTIGGATGAGAGGAATTSPVSTQELFSRGTQLGAEKYQQYEGQKAAEQEMRSAGRSANQQRSNTMDRQRSEFDNLYGNKLPDNPFYDPDEDLSSAQEGVF